MAKGFRVSSPITLEKEDDISIRLKRDSRELFIWFSDDGRLTVSASIAGGWEQTLEIAEDGWHRLDADAGYIEKIPGYPDSQE